MDGIKLNALCVKAVDYKDNKTLLTLCTIEKGKINAAIRGTKSEKSKLRYAASLLCFGEYILSERGGYYTVTNCTLIDGFYNARNELEKLYSALSVSEILDKITVGNADISEHVYLALSALKDITYKNSPLFYLLKYMTKELKLLGYGINIDACMNCGAPAYRKYFDISLGGGVCLECQSVNSMEIAETTFNLLSGIISGRETEIPKDVYVIEGLNVIYKYFSLYNEVKINALTQLFMLNPESVE
ncbi:MAG: DNA repair protein RecO [Clostridiales bacterium]|jgi:DNA repair protein RecO (recombination protein O)|nr:DNA repair protein RecO [Clostridiales bacterium]